MKVVKQEYVAKAIAQSQVLSPTTEVPAVDNEQTTDEIVTPTNSSVAGRQKEVPTTAEIEVHSLVSHETHPVPLQGTFSMALKDVNNEIAQGNLHNEDLVLQRMDEQVAIRNNDDREDIIAVPTTQLVRVVADEKFDDVVQKELQVVKKLWADMAVVKQGKQEEPFMTVVSKSTMKKIKNLARSTGQTYHTKGGE
ncbi:hypothetical protein TSUD_70250 [Trifolium subterraneum]|uniref:Uncharacterized protein n=1 Tax=Trifolium subterraneum TaxID=3900 RepID=A0A2Z6MJ98_TRISU|nr:hypothetical protein TSUD_70250 [Trifolium subterraneum]